MAQRRALDEAQREAMWTLYLARMPQSQIAERFGISRTTVVNTVSRIKRELAEAHRAELEEARAESLHVYQQVQREAWRRLAKCDAGSTSAVGYLGAILTAQTRHDTILGLDQITVNHRGVFLSQIQTALTTPTPISITEDVMDE